MVAEGSNIKVYGYDSVTENWIPIQVDINGALVVTT